ncbi:Tetratricopeptide-like helical [Penicillium vulpinum]|uniref:Protein kinase domain-containing protein n=1 Tax=Penicillium vulpinum TaxID=29845 RepID=A0A1V6S1N5_9EURO|nr:Tetratricopeptide-like helical [Penicillium vulpinum]KAJ5950386.1 Tetratricopeptide-like helical [Penicillium vulpinum]OQE07654.1 hypothetical protein PENVUL_c012G02461 [Penicillium vulpinum]
MARIPGLVLDSKLRTIFVPDSNETVRTYEESDPTARRRLVSRMEHWKRQKKTGRGGCGSVCLEQCIKGRRETDLRAVQKIETTRQFASIGYLQEEAVAKFSHSRYDRCFVKSFGWYEIPDALFIVMEHLELDDLWHYLRDRPPLPITEARESAHQILEGLLMMHENEFTHRDL